MFTAIDAGLVSFPKFSQYDRTLLFNSFIHLFVRSFTSNASYQFAQKLFFFRISVIVYHMIGSINACCVVTSTPVASFDILNHTVDESLIKLIFILLASNRIGIFVVVVFVFTVLLFLNNVLTLPLLSRSLAHFFSFAFVCTLLICYLWAPLVFCGDNEFLSRKLLHIFLLFGRRAN